MSAVATIIELKIEWTPRSRMNSQVETQVARHYARNDLERAILEALVAAGKDLDRLTASDLAPADEFHTAGRQATIEFAAQIDFAPGMHLLDVGCGIGGASRYFATERGCRVTGIDLTPEYVETAKALAQRVGLPDRVSYRQASALELPFEPATFDGAYMMHVGMNIEAKPALFAQIRRVLKGGGRFGIFDIMRTGAGELRFPMPWATTPDMSFVAGSADYRRALETAGFEIIKYRDRGDFARDFFRQLAARTAEAGGPPPLGTHILMKHDFPQKVANLKSALEERVIAPIELICRAH